MRIAMVGTKGVPAKWGGIEKYIEEVGQRLVERGHEVTVFGSRWFLRDYRQNTYKGMKIRRVPAIHLQATDAMSNALMAAVIVAAGRYDIVNFHGYASYYFVPFVQMAGKTVVVTSHGLVDTQWQNPKYSGFGNRVIQQAGKIGLRRADRVATVADYWRRRIGEEFQVNAWVLPSGVDPVDLHSPSLINKEYGLHGMAYVLFLGRIDPIKRIEWVLDITSVLPKELKIVIAGGTQDSYTENYLEKLRKQAAQDYRIIFTGPVIGQKKAELLTNCRLLVAPSSSEGLPIVVLEAMSYGRCCIASNIAAHSEVIEHRQTGYLFESYDKAQYLRLVEEIARLSDRALDEIGSRAREMTLRDFNWDRTAQLTEKMYQELINESKK